MFWCIGKVREVGSSIEREATYLPVGNRRARLVVCSGLVRI